MKNMKKVCIFGMNENGSTETMPAYLSPKQLKNYLESLGDKAPPIEEKHRCNVSVAGVEYNTKLGDAPGLPIREPVENVLKQKFDTNVSWSYDEIVGYKCYGVCDSCAFHVQEEALHFLQSIVPSQNKTEAQQGKK